jgi:hypothetical protein
VISKIPIILVFNLILIVIENIKDNGKMILNMVKEFRILLMGVFIKDFMSMVSQKALVGILGQMDNFMKENGLMEWNTAQECGKELKEILM